MHEEDTVVGQSTKDYSHRWDDFNGVEDSRKQPIVAPRVQPSALPREIALLQQTFREPAVS